MSRVNKISEQAVIVRRLGLKLSNETKKLMSMIESKELISSNKNGSQNALNLVIDSVCTSIGLSEKDALSKLRKTEFVLARHMISYIANREYGVHESIIATRIGRDRTTVLHSITVVEGWLTYDKETKDLLNKIMNR